MTVCFWVERAKEIKKPLPREWLSDKKRDRNVFKCPRRFFIGPSGGKKSDEPVNDAVDRTGERTVEQDRAGNGENFGTDA